MCTSSYGSRPPARHCWVRTGIACSPRVALPNASRLPCHALLETHPSGVGPCLAQAEAHSLGVRVKRRLASRLTARPRYTVLKPLTCEKNSGAGVCAKAELRQYEPCLVAEISVKADDIATAVSRAEQELTVCLISNRTVLQ